MSKLQQFSNYNNYRNDLNIRDVCICSGINFFWYMKQAQKMEKIKLDIIISVKNKDYSLTRELQKKFLDKREDISNKSLQKAGIDITKVKNNIDAFQKRNVFESLLSKLGRSQVCNYLYSKELIKVYNLINSNDCLEKAFLKILNDKGVDKKLIKQIIYAIKIKDDNMLEKSNTLLLSCLKKKSEMTGDNIDDFIYEETRIKNLFMNVEDRFQKDVIQLFGEVYFIKALFSETFNTFKK